MRPLGLSVTGFRSYLNPVTVDFTGQNLAAALGDTGAGKSSLLDAITFALYRKSSWDAKEPRQLIADHAQAMSVELTFLHDGHRWYVHRTMHATNANAGRHHLTNLDTGEEVDGATAVDARIRAVLQMGYDTFLRVGLLPQGKFDQLLTAPSRERSERLRELFGADSLATIQQIANRQCLSLTGLLGDANTKRKTMHDNPAQTAAIAGRASDAAETSAERLDGAIASITSLHKEVATAREAAAAATAAAQTLAAMSVPDAKTILDKLEPVCADIATRRESLDRSAALAADRVDDLTAKIEDIEANGAGREALGKSAVILENLAVRAEEHRGERDRLAKLTEQLAVDGEAIASTEAELAQRAEQVQPLTEAAATAASVNKRLRTRATKVRSLIATATAAALRVAHADQAHSTALGKLDVARRLPVHLEGAVATAEARVTAAEVHLNALQLRDRAAGIADELGPDDDCPVCRQHLPADFEPASVTSAADLRGAKSRLRDAKGAHEETRSQLAQARATATMAETAVSEHAEQSRTALRNAQQASEAAQRALVDFASFAAEAEGSFDAETAVATLIAATAVLVAQSDDNPADLDQVTEPISAALTACEQAAVEHVDQLRTGALRQTAVIDLEHEALVRRKSLHTTAVQDCKSASSRHVHAVARTAAEIRALPDRIRMLLADDAIAITADAVAGAEVVVAAGLREVQEHLDARDAARTEQTTVLTQQRALDQETRTAVDRPLNTLRGALAAWANAAARAIVHLDTQHQAPETPVGQGIVEIRMFATELSTTALMLDRELTQASAAHSTRAKAAEAGLRKLAAALADIDGFDPAADLTASQVLHPLVAAKARAAKEAETQRKAQRVAQDQVKPAADLDFAIVNGEARLAALDVLRRELVDAKFLGHLTALNTRALLGIASDLLGRLTDLRFGFANNFDIVSRTSDVTHNPNRLSGGEKFLASLALALALAELHSRSGPRLGSLFLDEGFAALDAAALETALDVLRGQAGGERLVLVISHLHAVAEAVDDVLWVERSTAGSTARWLSPAERNELVQADVVSGLQALA